jgi:hypothetical protein
MEADVTTAPGGVSPLGVSVFLSYSHDQQGRATAAPLVEALAAYGVHVVWDRMLPKDNPLSMQQWMEDKLTSSVVICLLTPDYVRGFDHRTADGTRRGTRYEIRILRQLLYDTDKPGDCAVIPVALPDFPMADVPKVLRSLSVQRFDPVTGAGLHDLVGRIVAIDGAGRASPSNVRMAPSESASRSPEWRDLIFRLGQVAPTSPAAIELVRRLLALEDDRSHALELGDAFPTIEKSIKAVGDTQLMRDFSDKCLRMLRSFEQRLPCDLRLEARILICGRAWHLHREHKLDQALAATKKGIELARQLGDARTEAFGLKCLGRLHRIMAEGRPHHDAAWHLAKSEQLLNEAVARFDAIDGPSLLSTETGACHSQLARTALSRYVMLSDHSALVSALAEIERAEHLLPQDRGKDHLDAVMLRAEIEFECRRRVRARGLLDEVIEHLRGRSETADNCEILARAYMARARMAENKTTGVRCFRRAAAIFRRLGLEYAEAVAEWDAIALERFPTGPYRMSLEDVHELTTLTNDPRTRVAASEEAQRQQVGRIGNGSIAWRPNWRMLVAMYQFRD